MLDGDWSSDVCSSDLHRAGRAPEDIRLIAVSKSHPAETVATAFQCGQRVFGESRVQEAQEKRRVLRALLPPAPATEWHLIGHLQSNKARFVPEVFSWVHTLDSVSLARRIGDGAHAAGVTINALIQVNVAGDPRKHGVAPEALHPLVESLLGANIAGLSLRGLMTIGRLDAGPADTQRAFADLRTLRDDVVPKFGLPAFRELSMGMTGDFEAAIAEGATMVRIGSAIFGERA
jgi:pyridoxal phosphate enzyme (YggS family)